MFASPRSLVPRPGPQPNAYPSPSNTDSPGYPGYLWGCISFFPFSPPAPPSHVMIATSQVYWFLSKGDPAEGKSNNLVRSWILPTDNTQINSQILVYTQHRQQETLHTRRIYLEAAVIQHTGNGKREHNQWNPFKFLSIQKQSFSIQQYTNLQPNTPADPYQLCSLPPSPSRDTNVRDSSYTHLLKFGTSSPRGSWATP